MASGSKKLLVDPRVDRGSKEPNFESLLPSFIRFRNGYITSSGSWARRPGYEESYNTGEAVTVAAIIDVAPGFAILENGNIYRLDTLSKLTKPLLGKASQEDYLPRWVESDGLIIVADGGHMIKIVNNDSEKLGGDPPRAKFIDKIGSYLVASGYKSADGKFNEVKHNSATNPEGWNGVGDSDFFEIRDDSATGILQQVVNGSFIYFFKAKNAEVWTLVGGPTLFARHDAAGFDVGIKSPASLVKSINSLAWQGHTLDFYEVAGGVPKIISPNYQTEIFDMSNPGDARGFDFPSEYKIRWFFNQDEKCFVYDYKMGKWSEDNKWVGGCHRRLPMNCVADIGNERYFGDKIATGKIYKFSKDILDDDGEAIRTALEFQVAPFDGEDTRGFINRVTFRVKRDVPTATDTKTELEVRMRSDKSTEWQTKFIDMGSAGDFNPNVVIYPRLYGSEFEFEIVMMNNDELILSDIRIYYEGTP